MSMIRQTVLEVKFDLRVYNIFPMGYIEDLRRKRQGEIEAKQKAELARQAKAQAESERRQREIEESRARNARNRPLFERSYQYFVESGLDALIVESKQLRAFEGLMTLDPPPDEMKNFYSETHGCTITVSTRDIKDFWGNYTIFEEVKFIGIETNSKGTISFDAGFLGSSTVTQAQWQADRGIIERALDKALAHPKRRREPQTPSGWQPSVDGGGG